MNMMVKSFKLFLFLYVFLAHPLSAYASTSSYIVAKGDTLTKIARNHNTTVDDIMKLNNLYSDKLAIGQALQIPGTATVAPPDLLPAETTAPVQGEHELSLPQPDDQIKATQAFVNADSLNVRQFPSLESPILTKVAVGDKVDVIEKGPDWTKIKWQEQEAFVATMYLTFPAELPPAVQSGDTSEILRKLDAIIQPLLGTPYVSGGTTPEGFDCSGFTSYVYQQLGLTLPRTSEEQFGVGEEIPLDQALPGDLIFYDALHKGRVSHVAIYLGDGTIVHANGTRVTYEKVANMHKLYPYYGTKRLLSFAAESK
jgi:peptidoglycan endopeptidase LytE